MTLPPLPDSYADHGYDWIDLLNKWYEVPLWGSEGWNAGKWPYIILAFYDSEPDNLFAMVVNTEGDLDIKSFSTREDRDKAASEWMLWFWQFHEYRDVPTSLDDPRMGPYRI